MAAAAYRSTNRYRRQLMVYRGTSIAVRQGRRTITPSGQDRTISNA